MGDRGNILIKQRGDSGSPAEYIYLYTHWEGRELPGTLQNALKKQWRWQDESYLARIIFQQMVGDDKGETGYGISAYEIDGGHPYLIVDCEEQTVGVAPRKKPGEIQKRWTFEDFIKLNIEKEFKDF
jgi:hypothetical protein